MELLQRIDRYLKRSGMTPTRFGREVMGDPAFIPNLKNGREARARTVRRVSAYLDEAEGGLQSG